MTRWREDNVCGGARCSRKLMDLQCAGSRPGIRTEGPGSQCHGGRGLQTRSRHGAGVTLVEGDGKWGPPCNQKGRIPYRRRRRRDVGVSRDMLGARVAEATAPLDRASRLVAGVRRVQCPPWCPDIAVLCATTGTALAIGSRCVCTTVYSEAQAAMHWKGGGTPPPSRAPSLSPATAPLTPSASFHGICNRQ